MEKLPQAEAHDEALRMNAEIDEHEARLRELKGMEGEKIQENHKYKSIELPDMVGKRVIEVYEYLKATYGEEHLAKIPDNLDKLPGELGDGRRHYFFGSSVGVWTPYVIFEERQKVEPSDQGIKLHSPKLGLYKDTSSDTSTWESNRRAVLLED